MIRSVLFTKEIPSQLIEQFLPDIEYRILPSLNIVLTDRQTIENKINPTEKINLITSQNSVKAIENIELTGDFYVVGKKTAQKLQAQNRSVVAVENYAAELFARHLSELKQTTIQFFCGNNRRDYLVENLTNNNNQVNQIISYQSIPIENSVEKMYDAYVFFSPLSFTTFLQKNKIPTEALIFSVGTTTTEAIKERITNPIYTADEPLVEAVLEKIKKHRND